jgi:release factor glutamine methyltransferase
VTVTYDELVVLLRNAGCVFAEDEAEILLDHAENTGEDLGSLVARRVAGEPLEYIVGWVEFAGLQLGIEAGVFVPRQRTEFLVDQAIALAPPSAVILDLCCGCGALGIAVASSLEQAELHASDVDTVAVECARENVSHGGHVYWGDLFEPLPASLRGRVDLLLANVPYVPTSAIALMPPEARDHEPRSTLDGGPDGLAVLRRVAAEAPAWLAAGGNVFFETSAEQAAAAATILTGAGLTPTIATDDERGATVLIGRRD